MRHETRRSIEILPVTVILAACAVACIAPVMGGCRPSLEDLASKEAPCSTIADCCVVVDGCQSKSYVVGRDDFGEAKSATTDSGCNKCMPPEVILSCEGGQCVGSPSAGAASSHCGATTAEGLPSARTMAISFSSAGRVFSCGD